MQIAVIMDPLESIRIDHDTTYVLMREAVRRGHAVWHVAPAGVGCLDGRTVLVGRQFHATGDRARSFEVGPMLLLNVEGLDAVLVRTDPPFDADYLAVTQLLDLLPSRVFVMNRPSGLRDANEKLAALHFPDLGPKTWVGQNLHALDAFRESVGGSVVVKPLDGFGGAGVFLVRADDPNRSALLKAVTRGGTVKALAQEVVPGSEAGDRRIILLDGRPLGAVLRRNTTGAFAHNLAAGGEAIASPLTAADQALCERLAPWLRARGLWFAGIDVVGGRLIEINITSPTCLQEINRLDGVALEGPILDFVEERAGRGR